MNYFTDEKDWQWLFEKGIDWDTLLPIFFPKFPTEDGFQSIEEVKEFLNEVLINTGDWTANAVASRAQVLDENGAGEVVDGKTIPGPELEALYKEAAELQVLGLPLPAHLGGLGMPSSILMILFCQLSRACLSSSTQLAFFTSIAEMVNRFCDEETAQRIVPKIINGELSGSMNLTEPGCGSDLGVLKTTATPREDGKYLLNGSKIFITNGGGGVGFVLARIKGAAEGLKGISLFLCEQEISEKDGLNYIVAKNEHKMGMHGSFTTEVVYENSIATLVGNEGEGFKYMLHLMNEARIAVGFQALGTIEGALDHAIKYAEQRVQFGRPLTELPLMKRNLDDFCTERDAIRALLMDTVSHFDAFQKLDLKEKQTGDLSKEEKKTFKISSEWTRKRTPLVKYYACEQATLISQRAIQVLGGYGFMQEYPVERYHRDSFGPLLYEGTSQIQALMALKDLIKFAIKDPKSFFSTLVTKHPSKSFFDTATSEERDFSNIQYKFKKKLIKLLLKTLRPEGAGKLFDPKAWTNEKNIESLMIHAETLCQALSYIETLGVLNQHAKKDEGRKELFKKYYTLVVPRLEAIYSDWSLRA